MTALAGGAVALVLCASAVFLRWGGEALALLPVESNAVIDFKQVANNDGGFALGDAHWIGSIVQSSNSMYFEGMSVPQRIVFDDIPAAVGNAHSLTFNHQANKGEIHAYDFLTSWEQAVLAANSIDPPPPGLLTNGASPGQDFYNDDACDAELGPPASLTATCTTLRGCVPTTTCDATSPFACGAGTSNCVKIVIPDVVNDATPLPGNTTGQNRLTHGAPSHIHNIADRICNYETAFGDRTITIYATTPITNAMLEFSGYTSGTDTDADYTLNWTSSSTEVVIELAGHISVSGDAACSPENAALCNCPGYGPGAGAASISGGPYHFSLSKLDGASLGSQDNQIKGADIHVDCCPTGATGPGGVCDDGVVCTLDLCDDSATNCGLACSHTPNHAACDDTNACTDDVCDSVLGCVNTPDNSNNCQDAFFCNGNETCVAGVCQPGVNPCDDNVACTIDQCIESSDACAFIPDDSACPDDGNPCSDQVCNLVTGCGSVCNDTNSCDNGAYCDGAETCDNCVCTPGTPPCPPDAFTCTNDFCDEAGDVCVCIPSGTCDDGLFCNGVEMCVCGSGCVDAPDPCPAPLTCDEANDECDGCVNDSQCQDGLFCNGFETCDVPTANCQDGPDPCLGDNIDCTSDICDEGADLGDNAGTCQSVPNNSFCDDSNVCTNDVCDPLTAPPATGCVHTCNTLGCDDLNLCTINDVCSGSAAPCVCSGTPTDCSSLNDQCNVGQCDAGTGNCVAVPTNEGGTCSDGLFCTCGDVCVAGTCTPTGSGSGCCDDGITCTNDSCNEMTDMCVNVANDAKCDDGLHCNGAERCEVQARDCVDGADPCFEDSFTCTTIQCDESNDSCFCSANNLSCDDFDPCTDDLCVCGTGCVNTPNSLCGACCDGENGICQDDMLCTECLAFGFQHDCFPLRTCADILATGECQEHRGACCDANTGTCTDNVLDENCQNVLPEDQYTWFKEEDCLAVEARGDCNEHTGACCDHNLPGGSCVDNVPGSQCVNVNPEDQFEYFKGMTCADVETQGLCNEHTGACCDHALAGGACTDAIPASICFDGSRSQPEYFKGETCATIEAQGLCNEHIGACCDRRISDPVQRCQDNVPQSLCIIDDPSQVRWFKDTLCGQLDADQCSEHTGACCDTSPGAGGPEPEGACTDGLTPGQCSGVQRRWVKDTLCADIEPACLETTGACCNTLEGSCANNTYFGECQGDQRIWSKAAACDDVECEARLGACCDQDPFGICQVTTNAGCNCDKCVWSKLLTCDQIDCTHNSIPTVSEWGLVVLTLLLLTGAKLFFGRREGNAVA